MTKHEQNSQNFANQNKTSNKDPRENEGGVGVAAQHNRPNNRDQKSGKRNDN